MPVLLQPYREEELQILRGDHPKQKHDRAYQDHDRVYRYDLYNDLGDPDNKSPRPTLGGPDSPYPYPRRGRTGRKPMKSDPTCESRNVVPVLQQFYVPRDECFNHVKKADFTSYLLKAISAGILPLARELFDTAVSREFDDFEDMYKLYEGGIKIPDVPVMDLMFKVFPPLKSICPSGGSYLLKMPMPEVIKNDKLAWRTDEEFAREMLAGLNPHIITRLQEFPPRSKLDGYGDQTSTIKVEHIQPYLGKLTVDKAITDGRLFILDHHDNFIPQLHKINSLENTFVYATRTLLILQDDDTLKPIAIELSRPRLDEIGTKVVGADSKVYTPPSSAGSESDNKVQDTIWQLAKAYAAVNDSTWHGLISHWLHILHFP
jgi:linoleate 9S-lipoxygenase